MNRQELITAMAEKATLTKKDAEKALAAFTEVVQETLISGEKVQIVGFGSFEVVERAARTGRNPQTGESISIDAKKSPKFKPGKILRESVK